MSHSVVFIPPAPAPLVAPRNFAPVRRNIYNAITERSTPFRRRFMAVLWRRTCGDTRFVFSDGHFAWAVLTCCATIGEDHLASVGCGFRRRGMDFTSKLEKSPAMERCADPACLLRLLLNAFTVT
jgi:hypothetical protein